MLESARNHAVSRRDFLRRALITGAGASALLLVGDQMWEQFDRLRPRQVLVNGRESLRDRARRITAYWSAGVHSGIRDASLRYEQMTDAGLSWSREMYAQAGITGRYGLT